METERTKFLIIKNSEWLSNSSSLYLSYYIAVFVPSSSIFLLILCLSSAKKRKSPHLRKIMMSTLLNRQSSNPPGSSIPVQISSIGLTISEIDKCLLCTDTEEWNLVLTPQPVSKAVRIDPSLRFISFPMSLI